MSIKRNECPHGYRLVPERTNEGWIISVAPTCRTCKGPVGIAYKALADPTEAAKAVNTGNAGNAVKVEAGNGKD